MRAVHERLGQYTLSFQSADAVLMTENETNKERVFGLENESPFVKDAFHDAVAVMKIAFKKKREDAKNKKVEE